MKTFKPSPKSRYVIWLTLLLLIIIILASALFFYSLAPLAIAIAAISLIIILISAAIILPIFINSFKIILDYPRISITCGLIIKRKIIINPSQIIYFTRIKSPISALFNLRTLKICMVGYRLYVPMLSRKSSHEIIHQIKKGQSNASN